MISLTPFASCLTSTVIVKQVMDLAVVNWSMIAGLPVLLPYLVGWSTIRPGSR